eukprot:CAMPEP_0176477646 /NCGR_PEP_ID=MMETSP0200_2-20121128/744_1 /TAXON_ID=947934 /ORGANISM="Chaetoceros sp., Strain GSL56" /LENGTH=424 /DNA_ID=CAMNT_0017873491 /DNA_START=135 /DNA_END=1409 /DNA_ORIENTATION=+
MTHYHHQVNFQVSAFCTHCSIVTIKTTSSGSTQNAQEVSTRYRLQKQYAATEPSTDQEKNKINSKLSSSKKVGSLLSSQEEFNKPNAGESCSLDHHDDDPNTAMFTSMIQDNSYLDSSQQQQNTITSEQNIFLNPVFIIPIFTPFLAYLTYDDVARVFSAIFDILALERKWVPVDGGAYQAKIIAPAINGIVVPAISILFATLTSNTVSTLRQRQIDIHTYLNSEAGDLRLLVLLLDVFPESALKSKCRQYLHQYTCRLIAESEDSKTSKVMFGSTDSEMNGFAAILNELIVDRDGESSSNSIRPPETILSESFGAVVRLNTIRSSRITALQSTFPVLHYGILTLLAASICLAFLLETNQELLIFLNAIQLRILWTMLIGAISALGVVCWDLSFPFAGSYVISNAVDQLKTIRDTLRAGQSKAM